MIELKPMAPIKGGSLKEIFAKAFGKSACEKLEDWIGKDKSRSASIDIDDGYGATCWRVVLRRGENYVECWETRFIGVKEKDQNWNEENGNLHVTVDEDEPGLEKTILYAIQSANKFWNLQK